MTLSGNMPAGVRVSTLFSDVENVEDIFTPKVIAKHVYVLADTEIALKKLKLLRKQKMR